MKKYLAIGEVAKLKGVRVETVRDWTNSGKLELIATDGGHRRYPVEQFEARSNL